MKNCIDLKLKHQCYYCSLVKKHSHFTIDYIFDLFFHKGCYICQMDYDECLAIKLSKAPLKNIIYYLDNLNNLYKKDWIILFKYYLEDILSINDPQKLKTINKMLLLK